MYPVAGFRSFVGVEAQHTSLSRRRSRVQISYEGPQFAGVQITRLKFTAYHLNRVYAEGRIGVLIDLENRDAVTGVWVRILYLPP